MLATTHGTSEGSQVTPASTTTESIVEEVDDAVSTSPLTEEMVHSVGAHVATDLKTVGVQVGPTKHKNALIQVNPKTRSMGKHTNNRS